MELTLDPKKRYTYADYLTWLDGKTRELLNGFISLMSPAPSLKHAQISGRIFGPIFNYVERRKGKCQVFHAPFDVRLPKDGAKEDDKIYTVVQPDICIVCDESKLDERGCLGAPDMVVEIISPSTLKRDMHDKFNLYEEAGVKEYWTVLPKEESINVFILQDNGKYDDGVTYQKEGKVPVQTLGDFEIDLKDIFVK